MAVTAARGCAASGTGARNNIVAVRSNAAQISLVRVMPRSIL
jgi:hypothetical protein